MRQLRATFLLLLFIASFGRCIAEHYGLISDGPLACCVEEPACCDDHDTPHHDEDNPAHHDSDETPECPICVIIESKALAIASAAELLPPTFALTSVFLAVDQWISDFPHLFLDDPDTGGNLPPAPPPRLSLSPTEMVLFSAPIRGPSFV